MWCGLCIEVVVAVPAAQAEIKPINGYRKHGRGAAADFEGGSFYTFLNSRNFEGGRDRRGMDRDRIIL